MFGKERTHDRIFTRIQEIGLDSDNCDRVVNGHRRSLYPEREEGPDHAAQWSQSRRDWRGAISTTAGRQIPMKKEPNQSPEPTP
jgi:hypothetical protein